MSEPRGYIAYRGPSMLNGTPIVLVVIMHSHNDKTGDLAQTYILADNGDRPTLALRTGTDAAVCGDCKHRPVHAGTCYVVVRQGATRVWQCMQDGRYPDMSEEIVRLAGMLAGRRMRLGTYGDPAAVPVRVWRDLTSKLAGWVGYTHRWHQARAQALREYCMASVDTPGEKVLAHALGWRTFRVRLAEEPLLEREAVCPASAEAGHKLQCVTCGACNGARGLKGNIAIVVHGAKIAHQPEARFIRSREFEIVEPVVQVAA